MVLESFSDKNCRCLGKPQTCWEVVEVKWDWEAEAVAVAAKVVQHCRRN
jgi:hypothetical protein